MKVPTILNSCLFIFHFFGKPLLPPVITVIPITSTHKWVMVWDLSKKEHCASHSELHCLAEHISLTYWHASEFISLSICLKGTVKSLFMVKDGL